MNRRNTTAAKGNHSGSDLITTALRREPNSFLSYNGRNMQSADVRKVKKKRKENSVPSKK